MGKRLERLGEVEIVDETNGIGLDFVKKTESWVHQPRRGSNTQRDGFGICI